MNLLEMYISSKPFQTKKANMFVESTEELGICGLSLPLHPPPFIDDELKIFKCLKFPFLSFGLYSIL